MAGSVESFGTKLAAHLRELRLRAASENRAMPWVEVARAIDAFYTAHHGDGNGPSRGSGAPAMVEYTPDELEALRLRICAFRRFNRRPTTRWQEKELKALRKVFPYHPEDLRTLERYYNEQMPKGGDYRRREVFTLLNHFAGEIDLARKWDNERRCALHGRTVL